jgi:SAM-dependent methyltransferase
MIKLSQPAFRAGAPADWPVPPTELMEYGENAYAHLSDGKKEFESMCAACAQAGAPPNLARRALDFGCSNGRVTRWFSTRSTEVWGVDVQEAKVLWANENLGPPLRFMPITPQPHLPFPDGYFDFICAQSVFTHIQGLHIAWLLELCRVISRDGILFITLHDAEAMDSTKTTRAAGMIESKFGGLKDVAPDLSTIGFLAMNPYPSAGDLAQVYMSSEYVMRILPEWMALAGRIPRAYWEFQTAYVFRKML